MSNKDSFPNERIIPIQIESASSAVDPLELERPSTSEVDTESSFEESDTVLQILGNINPKRTLPMVNVKEKIILVIDSAEDENYTSFLLNSSVTCKPLEMLKRAIEIFLQNKNLIDKKHEYALAVLTDNNVLWLEDFTSNINKISKALQKVEPCETEDIFELNSLFTHIKEKIAIPEVSEKGGKILPPPYVVRVVLLYGRSYTMPKILENEEIQELLKSPYFTLDVLMTHEPVDDDNNCNKIFNVLQNLDQKGFAYFFSVERDAKRLFNCMGNLLGHPLQRPIQKYADYSIKV